MRQDPALDRLTVTRFFAAMIVVCFHLGRSVPGIDGAPWSPVLRAGPIAVTFFFVLSGFVMAVVHHDLRPAGAVDFWRARFARIYPVYLLGLACCLSMGGEPLDWLLNLLLVQAWAPGHALSINLVGWSLSVEVFFYACFPAMMLLAHRVSLARWTAGVAALWLGSQLWAAYATGHVTGPYGSPAQQFVDYFPLPYHACFLIGVTTGLLIKRGHLALSARTASALLLASSVATVAMLLRDPLPGVPKHLGLLAPLFAAMIVALYHRPSRWRSSAPARLLGEASYALYIVHIPFGPMLQQLITARLGVPPVVGLYLTLAALIGVAVLVFRCFETPARAALRRRRSRQPAGLARPATA